MASGPYDSPEMILAHLAEEDHVLGAVVPPIFQNSLFVQGDCEKFSKVWGQDDPWQTGFVYSRIANPTLDVVERKIAALEHCEEAKVFGSGMAAISAAIFSCVESGSHVVLVDTVYGPTKQLLCSYLARFGVTTTLVEGTCVEEILDAVRPETTLIYLESPSSFLFHVQDLEAVCRFAKAKGITTAIDNSCCSPIFQNPADFGVDVVLHSATKYLAGHSDLTAGVVACSSERMQKLRQNELALFGGVLAPLPAWLLLRGMRTLAIRMKAHQEAGKLVAAWLEDRPEVERVFYPGLPSHPQRDLIGKQQRGSGGLLAFEPKVQDEHKVKALADSLKVFQLGVSWGGFESLVVPLPIKSMTWDAPRWIVRLYCGLEPAEVLIRDVEQALGQLR